MDTRHITWASAATGAGALLTAALGAPPWAVAIAAAGVAGMFAHLQVRSGGRVLAAALRRRDEQLSHTVHELRTPLASVVTALEMVREDYAANPEETLEFIDLATFAAHHLGLLVNDVLDDAALAASRLRLQARPHRVTELVHDAVQLLGLQARVRRIGLQVAVSANDLWVLADERRFRQILFNLVGNSMKFSAPGASVRIEVDGDERAVQVRVVDHGPGVPQQVRERLFTAFSAAEVQSSTAESTGLGLHVCRGLVEHMGGRIGYLPGEERGSIFWFELPRAAAPAQAVVAPAPAAAR